MNNSSKLLIIQYTNKIGIIFINGTYNSGKRKFAEKLMNYGQDNNIKLHLFKWN